MIEIRGTTAAQALHGARDRAPLIVTDERIPKDEHGRGEDLLQRGYVVHSGHFDRARQEQHVADHAVEPALVLDEVLGVEGVAQNLLVLFQGDEALHEDPAGLLPRRQGEQFRHRSLWEGLPGWSFWGGFRIFCLDLSAYLE